MTKSTLYLPLVLALLVLSFSACKSTEVASDGAMEAGLPTMEEEAADIVEVSKDASMAAELLDKHFAARGGLDKLKAVQTMSWEAGMEMMGMSLPLKMQFKRPNKMYSVVEVEAMNATIIQGFDGTTAWMLNPMAGSDAQKLPDEMAKEMQDRAAMDGALLSYVNKGYEISYEGEEMVNEKPAHKLLVQLPEENTTQVFLDSETFLEVKIIQSGSNPQTGEQGEVATYSSDYREIEGIMIPHKISAEFNGQPMQELQIESVKINMPIDDSIFEMPGMTGSMN